MNSIKLTRDKEVSLITQSNEIEHPDHHVADEMKPEEDDFGADALVIVDPGQDQWLAKSIDLTKVLIAEGWTPDSLRPGIWREPAGEDGNEAYAALCDALISHGGHGGSRDITESEEDSLQRFVVSPELGAYCWEWRSGG